MALHPEFAPIAFVACFSTLLPLPWHWRARNTATLSMIFWLFVSNLVYGVNATVWGDNIEIHARVWCDISSKLIIGANVALPAACLCVAIYLEQIASLRNATRSLSDRRKRQWFELFMGFGLPIILMGLHFIVQGHRFDIIEGYGCRPTTYYSIPSILLIYVPPLIMAAGCFIFSGLSLRHFIIRRLVFAAHLKGSNSALTTTRYLRLVAMAVVQMIVTVGVTVYTIWFTALAVPLRPWTTWADVHSDFGRVDQYPALFYPPPVARAYYGMAMMVPVATFLFVGFFAFGKDAVDEYSKCWSWVKVKVLRRTEDGGLPKYSMKGFSFINPQGSKPIHLPISKPVLQSTTSSDYTLPPYEPSTPVSLSSLHKTITTISEPEYEYDYRLRDSSAFSTTTLSSPAIKFGLRQPKAIGSYSDLSIISPSLSTATIAPSEFTLQGHGEGYAKHNFSPQAVGPLPPPAPTASSSPSRLRPFLLGRGQLHEDNQDVKRPVSYPSHGAEWWFASAPHGQP